MSDALTVKQWKVLASWARKRFSLHPSAADLSPKLIALVDDGLSRLDSDARAGAIEDLRRIQDRVAGRALQQVLVLLRDAALRAWLAKRSPLDTPGASADDWLDRESVSTQRELIRCAMREVFASASDGDRKFIGDSFAQYRTTLGFSDAPTDISIEESIMAISFIIDPRALPKEFSRNLGTVALPDGTTRIRTLEEALAHYESELALALKRYEVDKSTEIRRGRYGFIIGTLLNREFFVPSAAGVQTALADAHRACLETTDGLDGKPHPNSEFFNRLLTLVAAGRGQVSFQEFAYVCKYALDNARSVPPGSNPEYLKRQVDIALDRYVSAAGPSESIEIPSLTGEAVPLEVEPPNIDCVATIYPALQLERMRLFDVVDRITELYMNGLLPIGGDAAGAELDDYHWSSEDRLSAPQRYAIYARVLGAAGGDVSKEVQPNRGFDMHLLRFVASLAEYDRQRRVADLIATSQPATLTSEQIRKSGRELASNASLYGWGGAHSAARRLRDHVVRALAILTLPQIQKVYGVSSPYQVIERVAMNEFGQAPNIVKYRTMAEAGKVILRLIAKHAKAWNTNTGRPLFPTLQRPVADIPDPDAETLIIEAQNWLAVNGIDNVQRDKMSQPSDSLFAPSMPAFGGGGGAAKPAAASPDVMNRLQQMVASGQTPTLDQIKSMLPMMGG